MATELRLLVGLDDREGGRDALALAAVLAGGGEASALVVSVLHSGPLPIDYALLEGEEAAEAGPLFELAAERLAGVELQTRAYTGGSPAAILTQIAEREEFDAIVVGSPHRGAVGRVMIGSVAANLLSGAPTDVAVAPKGFDAAAPEAPRTVGVAYDGTAEAKLALERAVALAERWGAGLKIVTAVVPPVAVPTMVPGIYSPQVPPQPEEVMAEARAAVGTEIATESVRIDGDPALALIEASEGDLDLLVVGSRGYGPLTRVLLGSVSREVAQKALCPVVIARRP